MICVFARKIDGSLTSLVKQIDEQVGKNGEKKLSAFVVFLTDEADKTEADIKKLAEKEKITNVPLTIVEPSAGPGPYKIAEDAEVTVMLWNGKTEVVANHAFKAGGLHKAQIEAVIKDIPKLLN